MAQQHGDKSVKQGKKVKNLPVKNMTARQAKGVKGGAYDAFRVLENKVGKV